MKFNKFVDYLEKLEGTSSRLKITEILVDLLEKLEVGEVKEGIYLLLGSMGPSYGKVEFNMATKMVMRAITLEGKMGLGEVEKKYKKVGDLGEVVREISSDSQGKDYDLNQIYNKLMKIALDQGLGSQERKVGDLAELLSELSSVERKYIVRVVLGKLRLGFSEKTILDAVSVWKSGDKKLRKDLDNTYQIYPDVGRMVVEIKKSGLEGLEKIEVEVGVPVVPALCQRINEYTEITKKMGEVAVERKFDGTRVQIHFDRRKKIIKTFTRNLEENSESFLELKEIGDYLNADSAIFDSEAVGIDKKTGRILPFQMTITRKRKHGVEEAAKSVPLRFYVFDVLSVDGRSLIEMSYDQRREILSKMVKNNEVLVVDEYRKTSDPLEIKKWHDDFLEDGYEGAVIKKWQGNYLPGRQGWNWVKIKEVEGKTGKLVDTMDLVVMGYYFGKGKRAGFGMGAFLVGLKKGDSWVSVAKIGTGLSDDEFRELTKRLGGDRLEKKPVDYMVGESLGCDVWVSPKVVVEIAADEITKSPSHSGGLALRFPRLIKFRDDKGPNQATVWEELEQIAG